MNRTIALLLVLVALTALASAGCGPGAEPPPAAEEPAAPTEEPTLAPATATPVPPSPEAAAPTATPVPPEEEEAPPTSAPAPAPPFEISSSAFEPNGEMPVQCSCEGANLSPPLEWTGVPEGTQSLALTADDPDSDPPGWVHWVVYNIPASSTGLPEGLSAEATLPDGTLQGANSFALYVGEGQTFPSGAPINRVGYDGPCPRDTHRYVFTLYALDTILDLEAEATMAELLQAMEGHVLVEAELIGLYTPQQ
jgi:Raf kinase inhibitor-like YbhB/YbcL family protein